MYKDVIMPVDCDVGCDESEAALPKTNVRSGKAPPEEILIQWVDAAVRKIRHSIHRLPIECPLSGDEGQCQFATKKRSKQCEGRAGTYAWLCDDHARDAYIADVKASTIPGAGRGLFAGASMDKGDFISLYTGPLSGAQEKKLNTGYELVWEPLSDYPCEIVTSAADTQSCVGRWLNDGQFHEDEKERVANNCEFRLFAVDMTHTAFEEDVQWVRVPIIQTTRFVKKGEELLVDYGSLFKKA